MKGWNNWYKVSQRVKRQENYIRDITNFENNNYLINQKIDENLDYEFHQNECFSLAQLIESMKCGFIKIYKGQVLIIILEVLKHLQQLHQKRLSHGKLKPQNIFIQLKNEKDNKLTIIQSLITIQKVYFINYRIIDDVEYEINYSQDVYDIIDCCIELIQAYSNTLCELLLLIINNLNQYKNNIVEGDIYKVLQFIDLLIKECVDQENQKFNAQTTSTIQCQEGEEYNMISKRSRYSTIFITKFLDVICSQSVDCELGLQNDSKENRIDQYVQYIDTNLLKQEELPIFKIFESIIRQQMMKIIWKNYGEFLESRQQEHDSKCEEIVKIINKRNKYILDNHLICILNEYNNIKNINDEIKEDIEQNYKFNIVYDEQKAKDQFILELKVQAQNYDFNNIQAFINNIKNQVKYELQEYYNQILELEMLHLDDDLI
ncbi:unnamed protein product (macronuclear) [Paramecium tetraurelia]|uniref:Protein kinase domain-containing protein n=1 Tax=Paramecium tetraurelia TaxID=5888 RepID=A0CRC7_PARTE|nr:uncharacterized protein GSPATT00009659001 [Paramecium tetraurelia]CAK73344.1 unnamed protein product [Paramecium tetraurelia]|eukprot:XP_001440741.1 hypothetical protein (macronuclear) [Paramecium tetraurelia strain d4-2]